MVQKGEIIILVHGLSINSKATYNRNYKPIKVGDKVRTYVKPKSMKKGNVSAWS